MQIIADLHIHSKYSRAVSQRMDLTEIAGWATKKGIDLVTTGDWTHPLWIREIKNNLKETAAGIYTLKNKPNGANFILTTEISSIYNQGGKTRRIHNLIFSPSIETCDKIIRELQRRGTNLMADGRPITGISSRDLLTMIMEIDERTLLIPCHAWTPWFSLYGSKSGFDSIDECFGDLADNIFGVETGLSSDPIMNWQIKELKNRSIISSSDAHSGPKLGREATVFISNVTDYSYTDIVEAIKQSPDSKLKIGYTIEFFPQEGKYHWSGHRTCGIRYNPQEVREKGEICPICHRPLTIGVENRVIELSEKVIRENDLLFLKNKNGMTFVYDKEKKRKPFVSLVPLLEILTEIHNSPTRAGEEYERLNLILGSEFDILLKKSFAEIEKAAGERLSQAIKIMRERQVFVDPGYDGVFGKVKIFNQSETTGEKAEEKLTDQPSLF